MKTVALLLVLILLVPTFVRTAYTEYRYSKAAPSVVELLAPDGSGGGTGFELQDGDRQFTVTNGHVCELGKSSGYMVLISPHSRIRRVSILEVSPYSDICLLEPVTSLPALPIGGEDLKKGDSLTILGHPLLGPLHASNGKITIPSNVIDILLGDINSPDQEKDCQQPKNRIIKTLFGEYCTLHVKSQRTTALIKPGNSGSPVLDFQGRVRGIAFASDPRDEQAEIIPLSQLKAFLATHIPYSEQSGHGSVHVTPKYPKMPGMRNRPR